MRYDTIMNLLSVQGNGFLYTFCLFLLCVIVVHGIKLARIGWRAAKKRTPEETKKPEPKPEPVYFIVERKKKRAKAEYSEPKRIRFRE